MRRKQAGTRNQHPKKQLDASFAQTYTNTPVPPAAPYDAWEITFTPQGQGLLWDGPLDTDFSMEADDTAHAVQHHGQGLGPSPANHSIYQSAADPQPKAKLRRRQASQADASVQDTSARGAGILWLWLSFLSLAIIAALVLISYQASLSQRAFDQKLKAMSGGKYFPGIYVDGMELGQLSQEEASRLALQRSSDLNPNLQISIQVDDIVFPLSSAQLPFKRSLNQILEEAWSIGRQDYVWGIGSGRTPFEIRWQHTQQTLRDKAWFHTTVSYDKADVLALAQSIAQQVKRDAINAVVSEFNFNTKTFAVTQDVPGRVIDPQEIEQALTLALDTGQYDARLQFTSRQIMPKVSSSELRNSFTLLASFSTKTTSDAARNNNIALAAQAINNTTLMPDQVFSFNEATGKRTMEKGYQGAPAIAGGVLIDDVGGGVCQVSSTLFHAAASAGLYIVERSPHAWPVSYMDKGLDATVNWPNLDFKFKNNQSTPVFIVASYEKRSLIVEFYGMLSSPGESIRLEAVQVSSEAPPREPIMQQNPALPFGTQQELKPARTGYVVDTYRVFLRNGAEIRREKLFTSRYRMVQQVIEYN